MRGWLALIDEALGKATRQLFRRRLGVIAVISLTLTSEHHVQHVVAVVVPLRIEIAPQVLGDVAVVLEHEMNLPTLLYSSANLRGHLVEPVGFGDRMHGIEAQAVEAIFYQ